MEETSGRHHDIPTPCHRQGCRALDQKINEAAQGPIQPHSGYLQGWGIHDFSGQPDPEHYCPLCEKLQPGAFCSTTTCAGLAFIHYIINVVV